MDVVVDVDDVDEEDEDEGGVVLADCDAGGEDGKRSVFVEL